MNYKDILITDRKKSFKKIWKGKLKNNYEKIMDSEMFECIFNLGYTIGQEDILEKLIKIHDE